MNFLSISVILVSLLITQEFHSIDGSVEHIYEKLKQEVEDLFDSQEYESVDEVVKDSKVKIKYFDYYVATSPKPTTTTIPSSEKGKPGMNRDRKVNAPGLEEDAKGGDNSEDGGGGAIIFVVIAVVVVILVIGAVFGVFIYVRQSKGEKNRKIRKRPKRDVSRESLASIVTVSSQTGKPVAKAGPVATPSKVAVAKGPSKEAKSSVRK